MTDGWRTRIRGGMFLILVLLMGCVGGCAGRGEDGFGAVIKRCLGCLEAVSKAR